jgi:hypothetical protein
VEMMASYTALPIPSPSSLIPLVADWRFTVVKQALRQPYQAAQPNTGALLPELFPEPPQGQVAPAGQVAWRALLSLFALAAGALVLLLRIAGRSPVTTIWAEDRTVFLVQALASPRYLFASYAGYLQLLPRIIGQLVAFLPLPDAAAAFAISGAMTASAVALFVFHASAGHIRSGWLRGLLAAAVLLLPVAPLEIADSGVNTPWYLLFALFWAGLWRPRTRRGMGLAALIAFLAGASTPLALALAPLFIVRIAALRGVREQAVTAGFAVGLLLQLPVIASAHNSRLTQTATPGGVLGFVAHDVVLPAFGWHLAWWLQAAVGRNGATLLVGCVLAAVFAAIATTQPARVRLVAAAALGCGFLLAAAAATLSRWVTVETVHFHVEPGSRYTTLPIFLMEAAAIVAVDNVVGRARDRRRPDEQGTAFGVAPRSGWARARGATAAVAALVVVLSVGWITDFRSDNGRAGGTRWAPVADSWLADCQRHPDGSVTAPSKDPSSVVIPCARLRR